MNAWYTGLVPCNVMFMRRLFVIFLALLFPLNVLALSMSVSFMPASSLPASSMPVSSMTVLAMPEADATERAAVVSLFDAVMASPDMAGDDIAYDIDPDEPPPPAGMDFHDTVHGAERVPAAFPPERSATLPVPPRRGLDPLPPIKPPPSA